MPDDTLYQSDPIVAAVHWTQQALLGTAATIIATIAIAVLGALMLAGRVDRRRALLTILGCFVVFGASVIGGSFNTAGYAPAPPRPEPIPAAAPSAAQPNLPFDPYAGAAPMLRPVPKADLRTEAPGHEQSNPAIPTKTN